MADAYEKLTDFLETFHECAEPPISTIDENTSAMLIYQANMSNSLKTMMELMKARRRADKRAFQRSYSSS